MEVTKAQFKIIGYFLPIQRGNVKVSSIQVINALLYIAEHSCKWWALPERFGKWCSIYKRANRWAKNGVLDPIFSVLQEAEVINNPSQCSVTG